MRTVQVKAMKTKIQNWIAARNRPGVLQSLLSRSATKGQALVEFTLCFILLLIITWIPADFGLALMSNQIMGNAAREGARIGSASPSLGATELADIRNEMCERLQWALVSDPGGDGTSCGSLSNAKVKVELLPGIGTCNQTVSATVSGRYNFFFYQLFRLFGVNVGNTQTMTRRTELRWEHQC